MRSGIKWLLGGVAFLSIGCFFGLFGTKFSLIPFSVLNELAFGWLASSVRLLHAAHLNAVSLALFLFGVILMVAITQLFLGWLYPSLRRSAPHPRWLLRWTLSIYGALFCGIMAICSIVLTTHQLYWLSRSSDSLYFNRDQNWIVIHNLSMLAKNIQYAGDMTQWDTIEIQKCFWEYDLNDLTESVHPVWIKKDEKHLAAVILFPTRVLKRSTACVMVLEPGKKLVTKSMNELNSVLASFGVGDGLKKETIPHL